MKQTRTNRYPKGRILDFARGKGEKVDGWWARRSGPKKARK